MTTVRPTRFPDLGYLKDAPDVWRFVDLCEGPDGTRHARIGDVYRTRAELLACVDAFHKERFEPRAVSMTPAQADNLQHGADFGVEAFKALMDERKEHAALVKAHAALEMEHAALQARVNRAAWAALSKG